MFISDYQRSLLAVLDLLHCGISCIVSDWNRIVLFSIVGRFRGVFPIRKTALEPGKVILWEIFQSNAVLVVAAIIYLLLLLDFALRQCRTPFLF